MVAITEKLDGLLDMIFRIFGEVHEKHSLTKLETAHTELEELSVPVVPIAKRVAILPLIGSIDTHRAKLIMQASLNESLRSKLRCLIIDISGVSVIDSVIANSLFLVINTLKLIGVEPILTGIRPATA